MIEVEALQEEVDRRADERMLDVISILIARNPHCRKLEALSVYVQSKLVLHRQKKRMRTPGLSSESSFGLLKRLVAEKRLAYYTADCDCGACKPTNLTNAFPFHESRLNYAYAQERPNDYVICWNCGKSNDEKDLCIHFECWYCGSNPLTKPSQTEESSSNEQRSSQG